MKSLISFLVVISFIASAIAQEESPAPSSEEKPSATVEEPSSAMPTPEARPSAAAVESVAPMKTESAAPAPAKKAASPAAATSAAKPAAATSKKKMSVEAALKDNENKWEASYAAHDASVAQSMVANDFVGVYWDGKIQSKSGVIGQIKKDKDNYKSATNEKLAVHSYGPTVAVVVGTAREKGTSKDGKAFDRSYRFTDTWVERNGQWQCVASQVMKVKG